MMKLLAIDVREGWAFVEHDEQIFLIRSPYRDSSQDKRVVSQAVLARAVQDQDFEPQEREFSGWASLIQFVKASVLDYSKRQGRSLEGDVGDEWIAVAPRVFIEKFVDRIENDLLPANEFSTAQSLLESILLRSPLMTSCADLHERVRQLSLAVKAKQKAWQERREQMLQDNMGCTRLQERGELEQSRRIGNSIRRQGTMFS